MGFEVKIVLLALPMLDSSQKHFYHLKNGFVNFFYILSLKGPTKGVSVKYLIVLYQVLIRDETQSIH